MRLECPADRLLGQRPLQSGKSSGSTARWLSRVVGTKRYPGEQRGLHADGVAGVELEGVVWLDVARDGPLGPDASRAEATSVGDGIQRLPVRVYSYSVSNRQEWPTPGLSTARLESPLANLLSATVSVELLRMKKPKSGFVSPDPNRNRMPWGGKEIDPSKSTTHRPPISRRVARFLRLNSQRQN